MNNLRKKHQTWMVCLDGVLSKRALPTCKNEFYFRIERRKVDELYLPKDYLVENQVDAVLIRITQFGNPKYVNPTKCSLHGNCHS